MSRRKEKVEIRPDSRTSKARGYNWKKVADKECKARGNKAVDAARRSISPHTS